MPCDPGQYLEGEVGCQDCSVGTYSEGEFVESCISCPAGKTVSSGSGTDIEDCKWSKINLNAISNLIYGYLAVIKFRLKSNCIKI